jgi:cytochrome c oxidase assembly factor CtaG
VTGLRVPAKSPGPQPGTLLASWQHGWPALIALALQLAALGWYVSSVRRLGKEGRAWSPYSTASFVVGLVVLAYGYEGGVAQYERTNFTAHVVQILMLTAVAPALLAGGRPLRLALSAGSGRQARAVVAVLRSSWTRALTHPLFGFMVASATVYLYLLTPLYAVSMRHPAFLAYVHLQFFVSGSLMWWQVVGRDSLPHAAGFGWRFAVVVASVPVTAFLGLLVASARKPLYPVANTLSETRQGGNVLWAIWLVFVVAALGYLFVEWAREEERRAALADRQLDAALEAARSVAPGDQGAAPAGAREQASR